MNPKTINTKSYIFIALIFCILGSLNSSEAISYKVAKINTTYDGSHIEVSAFETEGLIQFTINNLGADMDGTRGFEIIEDDILLKVGSFNLNVADGNQHVLTLGAYPGIFTLYADQHPAHPSEMQAIVSIEIMPMSSMSSNLESEIQTAVEIKDIESDPTELVNLKLMLYPNPCTNSIAIDLSSNKENIEQSNFKILVHNSQGQLVNQLQGLELIQQLNTNMFVPGLYYVSVWANNMLVKKMKFLKIN